MIISHFKLKNWKNFKNIDLQFKERMFIVGPNASGKSNFLDAFRFLRDIAKGTGGGLQRAIKERGGLSAIRCLAARAHPYVEFDVTFAGNGTGDILRYHLELTQETKGYRRPLVKNERVYKNGAVLISRPTADDELDTERLTETYLEQTIANKQFREIVHFLNSTCYLHLIPQLLRFPEAFSGPPDSEDPFGRSFLERLAKTPIKTRSARLKRMEDALKILAPHLKNLKFEPDNRGVPHLTALYEHWRPEAGNQDERQFSDGTLRAIGLFWSLMEGNSLLLLEEPELSLNSEIVREIPKLIWKMIRKTKRQILISTHSRDLLSDTSIGGEETIVLRPEKEGTRACLMSDDRQNRVMLQSGMNVADVAIPLTRPYHAEQLSLQL